MKKRNVIVSTLLTLTMAATALAGCGSEAENTADAVQEETPVQEDAQSEAEDVASEAEGNETAEEGSATVNKEDISGNVVFYTADPEEIATEVCEAFISEYPNCTYTLYRSGTGNIITKLEAELEAGGTECNCFSFSNLNYIYGLEDEGLLYHWTPAGAENLVDATFGDMAYNYKLEVCGIAYNTALVDEAPTSYWDLSEEAYNGAVAFADPGYSGAALTAAVTHAYNEDVTGWNFYQAMKDNNLKFEQSNGNLQSKVSTGEYSAVVIVDYMARNAKAEGSPVDFVYPEEGGIVIYSPFCIMNTVKEEDKDAVVAFSEFLLSDTAQAIYNKYNYLPGVTTAALPEGVESFDDIKLMDCDLDYYVENSDAVSEKYFEMFPAN